MRQQDVADLEVVRLHRLEQLVDLVAGVDDHGVARLVAANDVAVLEERVDGADLENHS